MDLRDIDKKINEICSTLEAIANNYPLLPHEAEAIRDAAATYMLVRQHESIREQYLQLQFALGGHLTNEMKQKLTSYGIDPDESDDDNDNLPG